MLRAALLVLGAGLVLSACGSDYPPLLPSPNRDEFDTQVFPVLARRCAFPACHGAPQRVLRIYAPGRVRLDPSTTFPMDPLTPAESDADFQRTRSLLIGVDNPDDCLLLTKPLSPAAEGDGHRGVDAWGRDPFASPADPDYQTLRHWVAGALGVP